MKLMSPPTLPEQRVRTALLCVVTSLSVWLGGCATGMLSAGAPEFACKAASTEGVGCMSAREIYAATEGTARVSAVAKAQASTTTAAGVAQVDIARSGSQPPASAVIEPAAVAPRLIEVDRPMPIRSQAKVMRIWIAPWEDSVGDLNASGYIYTELEARRWNVGERLVAKAPLITPLQISGPTASTGANPQRGGATPPATSPTQAATQALTSPNSPARQLSDVSVGLDNLQPGVAGSPSGSPRR